MKILSEGTPRRSFIQKSIALFGLALLPKIDLLARNYSDVLAYNTIGLNSVLPNKIAKSFKAFNIRVISSQKAEGSDLLFIGKIDDLNWMEIGKKLRDHALIIFEKTDNEAKLAELKAMCFYKKNHLAQIESWSNEADSNFLFDKLTFIETSVDEARIHQSISYLNILSKVTSQGGLLIA